MISEYEVPYPDRHTCIKLLFRTVPIYANGDRRFVEDRHTGKYYF